MLALFEEPPDDPWGYRLAFCLLVLLFLYEAAHALAGL